MLSGINNINQENLNKVEQDNLNIYQERDPSKEAMEFLGNQLIITLLIKL